MYKTFTSRNIYKLACIFAFMGLYSCDEFFEKNLDKEIVNLKAPANNITTPESTISFWWDEIDGATGYKLQVVTSSFDSITKMILDSVTTNNTFTSNFVAGSYEWRVSAFNNSSSTGFSYRSFKIDSTNELSGSKVEILYPAPNTFYSKKKLNFKWVKFPSATRYVFEIRKDNENGNLLIPPQLLTTDTISVNLDEGKYYWSIQASNQSSSSLTVGYFVYIDITPPAGPLLAEPANNDTISEKEIIFRWQRASSLAPIKDSLIIALDSLFTKKTISFLADSAYFSIITPDPETYFWKVKSIDAAGNESVYSNYRKFNVLETNF